MKSVKSLAIGSMFLNLIILSGIAVVTFSAPTTNLIEKAIWSIELILYVIIVLSYTKQNIPVGILRFLWPIMLVVGTVGLTYVTYGTIKIMRVQLLSAAKLYVLFVYANAAYFTICAISMKAILVMRSKEDN